jgi:phosphoribosyl-ATP pyrophosphohydrolase
MTKVLHVGRIGARDVGHICVSKIEFEVMSRFSLLDLEKIIDARAASGGEASYTRKLLSKGSEHCAKKFGEEAVEVVIAGIGDNRDHLIAESADVLFHLLVLLKSRGVRIEEVEAVLESRTGMSGLEEKAARKRD